MPTYLHNAVAGMNAYGYGDTRNGIVAHNFASTGQWPEYYVHKNETFYIETGSLFVPSLGFDLNGLVITYCNPGFAYRRRQVFRPSWVPKRQVFVDLQGLPTPPTITDAYDHFNNPGTPGETQLDRVVVSVNVAGTMSWGRPSYFNNNYKTMIVGANGQFDMQPFQFPYTNSNNPYPSLNSGGIQKGYLIKFFTEDEFSLIVFEQVQDIYAEMNLLP